MNSIAFQRALALAAAAMLSACSSNAPQSTQSAAPSAAPSAQTTYGVHLTDKEFVQRAARVALGRYALGDLGRKSAQSSKARALAQAIASDGAAASRWIDSYAGRHHITVDKRPRTRAAYQYARLSRLHGAAFDRAYARAVVTDAGLSLGNFEDAARSAKDSALRGFAARTALQLKSESQQAHALAD